MGKTTSTNNETQKESNKTNQKIKMNREILKNSAGIYVYDHLDQYNNEFLQDLYGKIFDELRSR